VKSIDWGYIRVMSFESECNGKRKHFTLSAAQSHLQGLENGGSLSPGDQMAAYTCRYCGAYHVGHMRGSLNKSVKDLQGKIHSLDTEVVVLRKRDQGRKREVAALHATIETKTIEIEAKDSELAFRASREESHLGQIIALNIQLDSVWQALQHTKTGSLLFWLTQHLLKTEHPLRRAFNGKLGPEVHVASPAGCNLE
jgi:hypothetical protein